MFTIVKPPQVNERRRAAGEPRPEIISHRDDELETKKWSEKMRNEEVTYKHLRHHRDSLLESEIMYKKSIKELKREKAELINIYEPTYNENKVLKSIIEHGPDAVKMKKLQKARKELHEEVEILKDENQKLSAQMNDVMKNHTTARDYVLEKNWQEILVKNNKNVRETKIEQGPFPIKEDMPLNEARSLFERADMKEQDMYDLQLDTVEKEIQVILNNVKYLKKQKKQVDYAVIMRKGAVVRNSSLENAIFDKLDEDLKAFKGNIKSAKKKHDDLKQRLAEREKDAKTRESAAKDTREDRKLYKQVTEADKTKTCQTVETQTTEVPFKFNRSKSDISSHPAKLNKKTMIKQLRSRAVQTDFLKDKVLRNSNEEQIKYLDHNENKLLDAKQKEPKTISRKEAALEYAKKLLIRRRDTHPNQTEISENGGESQDMAAKDKTKHSLQSKRKVTVQKSQKSKGDTSQDNEPTYYSKQVVHEKSTNFEAKMELLDAKQKELKNVSRREVALEYANKLVIRRRDTHPNQTYISEHSPRVVRKVSSQINESTDISTRSQLRHKTKNFNSVTKLRSPRIKSRSADDLNFDYSDKIMNPVKLLNTSRSIKSRRFIDVNDDVALISDKVTSLPSHERHTSNLVNEFTHAWKSNSDLRALLENEDSENQHIKEFKCSIPWKDAYIHFTGEMQIEYKEKRDESAYDEVLSDLNRQYKPQGAGVHTEFQRTVQNFRHYKGSTREDRKIKHREADYFPSFVQNTPVRFTSDARQVNAQEIEHLMKKKGMHLH